MQNSDIPDLHSNSELSTILHSLTVQNTITSLTKTILIGEHSPNFPSFLPFFIIHLTQFSQYYSTVT